MKQLLLTILFLSFTTQQLSSQESTVAPKHKRALFIGDSITDGGWGRSGGSMTPSDQRNQTDWNHIYGHSYMMLCAAQLQSTYPERDLQFFNRGISGNTLSDMAQRWQMDALSLHPDFVTILVGTNDVEQLLKHSSVSAADVEKWGQTYRSLIAQLREQNPGIVIALGTPFVARVGRIGQASNYERRQQLISLLADEVRRIAHDEGFILIDFHELFAQLEQSKPRDDYWIWDGIHPTPAGHQRMANLWLQQCLQPLLGLVTNSDTLPTRL